MSKKQRHPVWDVYDDFRDAVFQVKAYSKRIHDLRRLVQSMDITLAIFTPSSAITGLFFWETTFGKPALNVLITFASIVAIAKPILRLDNRIRSLLRSLSAYTRLYRDLEDLKIEIAQRGQFDQELRAAYTAIRKEKKVIAHETALLRLSRREEDRLYDEVDRLWPVRSFHVPETD